MPTSTTPTDHDPELEWFLCCSDSALGVRSSLGAQIAAIERGGGSGGVPSDLPATLSGLDMLRPSRWPGARWKRCSEAFARLPVSVARVLIAHYVLTLPTESSTTGRQRFPVGVEARLGSFAGVALLAANDAGTLPGLLKACEKGTTATVERAITSARAATVAAHRAFREALRVVDGEAFVGRAGL